MRPARPNLMPVLFLAALAACDGAPPTSPEPAGGIEEGRGGVPKPLGKITVIVDADPDDALDFRFTLTGQKRAAVLDDDADPTLLNTRSWPSLPNGNYTLALVGPRPAGSDLRSIICEGNGKAAASVNVPVGVAGIILNTGGDITCTFRMDIDTRPLTVTVDKAGDQPDPTADPLVVFHALASHEMRGFTATDLQITNGTASAVELVGLTDDGNSILYIIKVLAAADGPVTLTIPAGVAINDFNVPNEASTSTDNSVTVDRSGPTVTLTFDDDCPDAYVTVQFSEPVTGFEAGDISLSGSGAGWSILGFGGSGATYVVTVSKGLNPLNMTVPANVAVSATGKLNVASSTLEPATGLCVEREG